jgi:hypothetical protein
MRTTPEIKETLERAGVEIHREVYEEASDYGEKARDVYWRIVRDDDYGELQYTGLITKRFIAQREALMWAVELLRSRNESIPTSIEQWADAMLMENNESTQRPNSVSPPYWEIITTVQLR